MTQTYPPLLCLLAICFIQPVLAESPVEQAEAGLNVSKRLCARCHAIDPAKPWDSIGSTPSFKLMAKKMDDYAPRLRSVTDRRPHTGQDFDISVAEIDQVIAYIQSLNNAD